MYVVKRLKPQVSLEAEQELENIEVALQRTYSFIGRQCVLHDRLVSMNQCGDISLQAISNHEMHNRLVPIHPLSLFLAFHRRPSSFTLAAGTAFALSHPPSTSQHSTSSLPQLSLRYTLLATRNCNGVPSRLEKLQRGHYTHKARRVRGIHVPQTTVRRGKLQTILLKLRVRVSSVRVGSLHVEQSPRRPHTRREEVVEHMRLKSRLSTCSVCNRSRGIRTY